MEVLNLKYIPFISFLSQIWHYVIHSIDFFAIYTWFNQRIDWNSSEKQHFEGKICEKRITMAPRLFGTLEYLDFEKRYKKIWLSKGELF